jgi:uncharacterized membrane protein
MKLFIAVFLLLGACNYNKVKSKPMGAASLSKAQIENPDFETLKAAVIGPKCLSCHSAGGGNQGGTNLESYSAVKSKLNRVLYRALDARDMPPREPLNEMEARILSAWADAGAPEKVIGGVNDKPGADLERGPTNWAKIRDGIFKVKCLDCHQAPNPEAGLELTDLTVVRANMGKIVDRVFIKNDMPLAPYPAFTPVENRIFTKWLANGTPE